MKYQTAPGLYLTDFTKGSFKSPMSAGSVPWSDHSKSILDHFTQANAWSDYPDAESEAAVACFRALIAAQLLLPVPTTRTPKTAYDLADPGQTMFDVPFRRLSDLSAGEIVFLGAPIDIGTTNFPGARFAPQTLRQLSVERLRCQLSLSTGLMSPVFLPALNAPAFEDARMSDLGDLPYHPGRPPTDYYAELGALMHQIYSKGAFPVVLGGDHSITYATVPPDPCDLVHFDAHCDLAPLVAGHCHHHGNVLTRLLAEERLGEVFHYGLRETSGQDTVAAGTHARGVHNLEDPDWCAELEGRKVFVSLDVDVLDPTVLPGTGTPVIGGLDLQRLCRCLADLVRVAEPVGLDVVELCPMRDASGNSERAVIEAIVVFLALLHAKRRGDFG